MALDRLYNKFYVTIPDYLFLNNYNESFYNTVQSYATATFNISMNRAKSPMHPVQFYNMKTKKWVTLNLLSDTGADYTVMSSQYGDMLGLPKTSTSTAQVTSGTGLSNKQFYMHRVIMKIGNLKPVAALVTVGPNVINALGRNNAMDKYRVAYTRDTVSYTELV